MTSSTHNNNKLTARLAARLERNSRRVIAGALVLTLLLTIPYFLLRSDAEASQDPAGEVFDLRDDIDERFESEIHGSAWIFESRSGDILTRDGLLEILENARARQAAAMRANWPTERLPLHRSVIDRLNRDTGATISGISTLAGGVEGVFPVAPARRGSP